MSEHQFPLYRMIRSNWRKTYDEQTPFAVVLTLSGPDANEDCNLTWIMQALANNCKIEAIHEAEATSFIHFGVDSVDGMKELEAYLKAHGAVPYRLMPESII